MSLFQPYTIHWAGRDHVIPADRIMRAIAVVEEHVTLHELMDVMGQRRTVKMVTMAQAYGALLRFVGVEITDEEVYVAFFAGGDGAELMFSAVRGLQMLMIPPQPAKGAPEGKARGEKKAAAPSSGKPSRRPAGR